MPTPPPSAASFWAVIATAARAAGREVIEKALILWYTAKAPTTPPHAKAIIYGALAYFISPIDAVPDFIPIVGFTDDLAAIIACLRTVACHITPAITRQAREQTERWL